MLVRNGLRRPTPEQWAYLWNANPHRGALSGIPLGWVLEHDTDGVVGTFRNIPFLYEWNERPIKVAVASAWAVDPVHRHQSLRLAMEYFKQPLVDLLLNTTAVEETSGKAFLKFRAARVPQPAYTTRLLWITGYVGFAANLLRARRIPAASVLQYPAASGAKLVDLVRYRRFRSRESVATVDTFDARFDRFWRAMRQRRERLHAVRDAATLTWRFALERQQPTIVAVPRGDALAGYAVLVRRDQGDLLRFEVADLQALDDDPGVLRAAIGGALGAAARQGVHLVALTGFSGAKRHALSALRPHVKTVPGWPLYYKAIDGALEERLRSADAWDLSLYDGDTLWSGMFADSAVA